jgi:hypothetical protein
MCARLGEVRRRSLIRDEKTAFEFAVDAYLYLYPLVVMDATRRRMTAVDAPGEVVGRAPANAFAHVPEPLPPEFRDVVRPCFDLLHSFAWLDVSEEPMVVSVPDAADRYYLLPLVDMWTDLFAAPGTRTSGNWPADYAVVARGWTGELPDGLRRIEAPTPVVWVRGLAQRSGGDDFQAGLRITPLSHWRRGGLHVRPVLRSGRVAAGGPTPVEEVDALGAPAFFSRAAELLAVHLPHIHDHAAVLRAERIGLVPGEPFDHGHIPRAVAGVLQPAVAQARFELHNRARQLGWKSNGWVVSTGTMGAWGTDYLKRAAVAGAALGAVMPEDLVLATTGSDGDGRPLDGRRRYRLRFALPELPPVLAFWSLTVYDQHGHPVPNGSGRYSLASEEPLERADDGSVEIAVQHRAPVRSAGANWLPCPRGAFSLCLRLYWPEREILERRWPVPPVVRVDSPARESSPVRVKTAPRG